MFLKLNYSTLENALVISGSDRFNTMPTPLCKLVLPAQAILDLVEDMRKVARDAEIVYKKYGQYQVQVSRGDSIDSLNISVEEVIGEGSRPIYSGKFDGYWGAGSMIDSLRKFRSILVIT